MFEKLTDPAEVVLWEGDIPVRHRYTPGVAGEAFLRALRDRGAFLASRCESCRYTYVPARMFCERCFEELSPGVEVGPTGTLDSFTVGYVGVDGDPLDRPVVLGLVRLDGADSLFLHFLLDWDDRPLEIGQRVEAVVRPRRERRGSILDIRGFRAVS